MNEFQEYFVHEFVEEYRAGMMSRRDMMRRVVHITGGTASAAALLAGMGVPRIASAQQTPAPAPTREPSPISVAADDPSVSTGMVTFENADDGATITAYEARPSDLSDRAPVVLVCHRNQGLEPHIQDVARRWATRGYIACAVDLLSREGTTAGIADKSRIPALLSGAPADRHVSDFNAAYLHYGNVPEADAERLGMNGFCFGGSITWRSIEAIPIKAAAPFYGGVPPLENVPRIQAAVLGVYSSDPRDFANNNRDQLEAALSDAGITHELKVFPDTRHDFYNDTGQAYNEEQALVAWSNATGWFERYL